MNKCIHKCDNFKNLHARMDMPEHTKYSCRRNFSSISKDDSVGILSECDCPYGDSEDAKLCIDYEE